jgi:hypothetical protein
LQPVLQEKKRRKEIKGDFFQFHRLPPNLASIHIPMSSPSSHQPSPYHSPANTDKYHRNNNNHNNTAHTSFFSNNSFWDPEFTFEFGLISMLKRYFLQPRHQSRPLQMGRKSQLFSHRHSNHNTQARELPRPRPRPPSKAKSLLAFLNLNHNQKDS